MSTALAVTLAVASSLCWAGLDASRKSLGERLSSLALVAGMTFGQGVLFALWAWQQGGWFRDAGYLAPGAACLGLNVVANVLFVRAVKVSPLSMTVPYLSLSPVFATVAAGPMLGEYPSTQQWLGVVAVVLGALLLSAGGFGALSQALHRFRSERGAVLMTIVAALWALTVALDKQAMQHAAPAAHGLVQTGGVCLVTLGWLAGSGRLAELRPIRGELGGLALATALGAFGMGLQLLAVTVLYAGVVETIKRRFHTHV